MSSSTTKETGPTDPNGPTGKLCNWIAGVKLDDVPEYIKTRAKYLILDGIACGLVGAHLPWSETAANAVFGIETEGSAKVWGWEKGLSPIQAALLNSTFIQGFELDDWHSTAPLHSNSIILPALFAAAQHVHSTSTTTSSTSSPQPISGSAFLLATLTGYETGPRIGLALHGSHMLTTGWHSGAIFGPAAACAAVSSLLRLSPAQIEDALGIACTQAGGLMSAQFESDVKRMQHGFAARNGLLGVVLARGGYVGIKRVLERGYGGFLGQFSRGNGKEVDASVTGQDGEDTVENRGWVGEEVYKGLGSVWQTEGIRVKQHSCMAAIHCAVECVEKLQHDYPEQFEGGKLGEVKSVRIDLGDAAFHHGGWEAKRPLTVTGAQMSCSYCVATQLLDGQVLPHQFSEKALERDEVWEVQGKIRCVYDEAFNQFYTTRVTVVFEDGEKVVEMREAPRSVKPGLTNEEIVEKYRAITKDVIDERRAKEIERMVLSIEELTDLEELARLLEGKTTSPIAG